MPHTADPDAEDYATIRRALTRFAWSITRKGDESLAPALAAARSKLEAVVRGPRG